MTLRTMIRERGLKQSWLANRLGIEPAQFSRILDGKNEMPTRAVLPIADILQVDAMEILKALKANVT